jgi:hypothetical protein
MFGCPRGGLSTVFNSDPCRRRQRCGERRLPALVAGYLSWKGVPLDEGTTADAILHSNGDGGGRWWCSMVNRSATEKWSKAEQSVTGCERWRGREMEEGELCSATCEAIRPQPTWGSGHRQWPTPAASLPWARSPLGDRLYGGWRGTGNWGARLKGKTGPLIGRLGPVKRFPTNWNQLTFVNPNTLSSQVLKISKLCMKLYLNILNNFQNWMNFKIPTEFML